MLTREEIDNWDGQMELPLDGRIYIIEEPPGLHVVRKPESGEGGTLYTWDEAVQEILGDLFSQVEWWVNQTEEGNK